MKRLTLSVETGQVHRDARADVQGGAHTPPCPPVGAGLGGERHGVCGVRAALEGAGQRLRHPPGPALWLVHRTQINEMGERPGSGVPNHRLPVRWAGKTCRSKVPRWAWRECRGDVDG